MNACSATRVLLVEDEFLIRLVMAEILEEEGFEVVEAASGDEAAGVLDGAGDFDLLLTDIQMPGELDGLALARQARRLNRSIAIVFVTGRPEVMNRAGRLGPREAFVRKPYGPEEVVRAVRRVLIAEDPAQDDSQPRRHPQGRQSGEPEMDDDRGRQKSEHSEDKPKGTPTHGRHDTENAAGEHPSHPHTSDGTAKAGQKPEPSRKG